jgi:hypothetical protein
VRYLGTVDCRRYPEAEAALVASLRGDENECVRLEAALALGRGCCCTRRVLQALVDTVSGKKTNEPAEMSERVKAAAAMALEHCLVCYHEVVTAAPQPEKPPEAPRPELPPEAPGPVARLVPDSLLAEAHQVLARHRRAVSNVPVSAPTAPSPGPGPGLPTNRPASPAQDLDGLLRFSRNVAGDGKPIIIDADDIWTWNEDGQVVSLLRGPVAQSAPAGEPAPPPSSLTGAPPGNPAVKPISLRPFEAPPAPAAAPAKQEADDRAHASHLPPTGQRDVWNVLRAALAGK